MKAKILNTIPKTKSIKKGIIYDVIKEAENSEGVWILDDLKNKAYIPKKYYELLQEDGVTKFLEGAISVSFGGLLPKQVNYDPLTKTLSAVW